MAPSVAILIHLVSLTAVLATEHLSLSGIVDVHGYSDKCLPGQSCYNLRGPNVTITHGDGSQSCLWLLCQPDSYQLILESPMQTRYHGFQIVGRDGQFQSDECRRQQYYEDGVIQQGSKAQFGGPGNQRMSAVLRYDACATENVQRAPPKLTTKFVNKVDILEFVHPGGMLMGKREDSLYLTSHTMIDIQCCRSTDSPPTVCTPPPLVPLIPLEDCTEKQFDLECNEDVENEMFKCVLKQEDGQVLGSPDMGFYLDSCTASTGDICDINLYSNGIPNAAFEVEVFKHQNGSADSTQYWMQSGYFQDYNVVDSFQPAEVTIKCTVKLALLTTVASRPQSPGTPALLPDGTFLPPKNATSIVRANGISLLKQF